MNGPAEGVSVHTPNKGLWKESRVQCSLIAPSTLERRHAPAWILQLLPSLKPTAARMTCRRSTASICGDHPQRVCFGFGGPEKQHRRRCSNISRTPWATGSRDAHAERSTTSDSFTTSWGSHQQVSAPKFWNSRYPELNKFRSTVRYRSKGLR